MAGQWIGSMVAATFGLVYVLANSGPLAGPVALALRVAAGLAFAAVLVAVVRAARRAGPPAGPGRSVFGRAYWAVVAVEFVALFAGARVLSGPLDRPEAAVAWVSLVVGVHFFALAVVFRQRFFHLLGAVIAGCGALGLALAFAGAAEAAVATVAGVLPGAVLLAAGWWGAHRTAPVPAGP